MTLRKLAQFVPLSSRTLTAHRGISSALPFPRGLSCLNSSRLPPPLPHQSFSSSQFRSASTAATDDDSATTTILKKAPRKKRRQIPQHLSLEYVSDCCICIIVQRYSPEIQSRDIVQRWPFLSNLFLSNIL